MLVDTAGLRRKRRHRQEIEYYSELRALTAAERADVALVLVDAAEGLVDQDLTVADVARKAGCSTIVVLSKWDITTIGIEDVRSACSRTRLRQRPPLVSRLGGDAAAASAGCSTGSRRSSRSTRAGSPPRELNRFLRELRSARPGPARNGRRLNLLYGTQVESRPPRFRLLRERSGSDHARLRLLGREPLRDRFALAGVPVVIDFVRPE